MLKHDRGFTYQQCLFPHDRLLESVAEMTSLFGDEIWHHLEFIRFGGRITASALPVVRFTTRARLFEIVDIYEKHGVLVANPHVFTLEDGSRHKRADGDQLGFKRQADPYNLLNPGKMRSYRAGGAMKVLYVYCHPLPESFHAAIRVKALAGLKRAGHEVDLLDLYAEGFDPVLSEEGRRHYHDETRNKVGLEPLVARLQAADAMVVQFPTWCFGLPAMLKGFCDRLLMPGVAFDISDPAEVKPMLGNIRKDRRHRHLRPALAHGVLDGRSAAKNRHPLSQVVRRQRRARGILPALSHERRHARATRGIYAQGEPSDGEVLKTLLPRAGEGGAKRSATSSLVAGMRVVAPPSSPFGDLLPRSGRRG